MKLTDNQIERMVESYQKGFCVNSLASEFGVSSGLAYKVLKSHTQMRKPGPKKGSVRSEKRRAILRALEISGRSSLAEIARAVGVSREYARQVAELSGHTQYRNAKPGGRKVYRGHVGQNQQGEVVEFPASDRWA